MYGARIKVHRFSQRFFDSSDLLFGGRFRFKLIPFGFSAVKVDVFRSETTRCEVVAFCAFI